MPVSIHDVAKYLGLSVSTVSRALNGYTDVSPATRERVNQAVHDLGYHANSTARSLRSRRTGNIGLVLLTRSLYTSSEYYFELIRGVAMGVEREGYNLVLYTTFSERPDQFARVYQSNAVDGFIVTGSGRLPVNVMNQIYQDGFPCVMMNRSNESVPLPWIDSDNQTGAWLAMRHLISLGRRRIAYIGNSYDPKLEPERHEQRYEIYAQALEEVGLPFVDQLMRKAQHQPGEGVLAMRSLLEMENPPDAVFAYNDRLAIEAMQAIREKGLRIPHDIAVVGFDDIHSAYVSNPPLTTVRQERLEIGQGAAEMLLQRIKGTTERLENRLLAVTLLVRQSTVVP